MADAFTSSGVLYLNSQGHRVILRAPKAIAAGAMVALISGTWANAVVALRWSGSGLDWTTFATISGPTTGGDFGGTSGVADAVRANLWCVEVMTAETGGSGVIGGNLAQVDLEGKG